MGDLLAWATFAVTVGILIATATQAWIYNNQAKTMREQANIMRQTLGLQARPHIRVRSVTLDRIYDEQSSPFQVGEYIYGRFEIVNVGGAIARVVTWRCYLRYGTESSPPSWPQNVDPDPESVRFESVNPPLSPGAYAELRYKSRYPLEATYARHLSDFIVGGTRLYAIGRVTYLDESGVARTTPADAKGSCGHRAARANPRSGSGPG
jgi:hypothetical protein